MIIKYLSFLIGIVWSYSIIKTQSVFSKKAGLIFKVFISNVSWLTLLAACYFGYKNFSIQLTLIGIIFSILIVHLGFKLLGKFFKLVQPSNIIGPTSFPRYNSEESGILFLDCLSWSEAKKETDDKGVPYQIIKFDGMEGSDLFPPIVFPKKYFENITPVPHPKLHPILYCIFSLNVPLATPVTL